MVYPALIAGTTGEYVSVTEQARCVHALSLAHVAWRPAHEYVQCITNRQGQTLAVITWSKGGFLHMIHEILSGESTSTSTNINNGLGADLLILK